MRRVKPLYSKYSEIIFETGKENFFLQKFQKLNNKVETALVIL